MKAEGSRAQSADEEATKTYSLQAQKYKMKAVGSRAQSADEEATKPYSLQVKYWYPIIRYRYSLEIYPGPGPNQLNEGATNPVIPASTNN
jgi:hypothetical protein